MTTKKDKHQQFINEYFLKSFNATDAYQAVYPKSTRESARRLGSQLLTNVDIKAEIQARLAELTMSADEALILLSEQARGSLAEFTDVQLLADLKDHPKARLIKHLTTDVYEDKAGKLHYKTRFELYDAQRAIEDILKIHGKFNNDAGSSDDKPFIVKVIKGVSTDDI